MSIQSHELNQMSRHERAEVWIDNRKSDKGAKFITDEKISRMAFEVLYPGATHYEIRVDLNSEWDDSLLLGIQSELAGKDVFVCVFDPALKQAIAHTTNHAETLARSVHCFEPREIILAAQAGSPFDRIGRETWVNGRDVTDKDPAHCCLIVSDK